MILPPGGSGVCGVMWASSRASELTQAAWPSTRAEKHRIARRGGVQIASRRELAAPVGLVPVAADDPLAGPARGGLLADVGGDLGDGFHVPQIARFEQLAEGAQMGVGVDEAGQDRRAMEVDARGARAGVGGEIIADGEDAAVGDGQGAGRGLGRG